MFVCVDAQRHRQQFFSHAGTESALPGYYQYFSGNKLSCSRTQNGGCRYRTPDLSLRSQRLYHSATALPRTAGKLSFVTDAAPGSILSVRMCQGSDHSSNVGGLHWYLWIPFNSASHHALSEFNPLLCSGLFAVFIGLNYHEDNPNKKRYDTRCHINRLEPFE